MLKTIIKQGTELWEQKNKIKQLKEENGMLEDELYLREINLERNKRAFKKILSCIDLLDEADCLKNDESYKKMTRNSIKNEARKIIQKELADHESN